MDGIILIGASGHAKVCLDILLLQGKKIVGFFDDDRQLLGTSIHGHHILGDMRALISRSKIDNFDYFVGIGNNQHREEITSNLLNNCGRLPINAIHPKAVISPLANIGQGNFISAGAIVSADGNIGNHAIINTGAIVGHESLVHDYAQISAGCVISGRTQIEKGAFLGVGAMVIPGKIVGAHATVGAGAVVIHDIPPYCTAVGVPARIIKQGMHSDKREINGRN